MTIQELQQQFLKNGTVVSICVRPVRMEPVIYLPEVDAIEGKGLGRDRYNNKTGGRQITLIQREHLQTVSSILNADVTLDQVRRNILVEGINLLALKGKKFQIGETILEYSGECHPCSRMETNLGTGGYNAMRGHGGITARIIKGGKIRIGDPVIPMIP